jgi:hypothetical protein
MIVGKLRKRWLIPLPEKPPRLPIFTAEKLQELQDAHARMSARAVGKPALMWDHKESVLRNVAKNGKWLRHAPTYLRNDKEVVLAAVKENGTALQFANPYLRANPEIALAACTNNGWALQFCTYRGDRDVVVRATLQNPTSIIFANHEFMEDEELMQIVTEDNLTYRDICLLAVQQDGLALRFVHPDLLRDREFCVAAVTAPRSSIVEKTIQRGGTTLSYCLEEYRDEKSFVLIAVEYDGMSLGDASVRLQQDRDVLIVALDQNGLALQYVGGGRGGILQCQVEGNTIDVKKEKLKKEKSQKEKEDAKAAAAAAAAAAANADANAITDEERQAKEEEAERKKRIQHAHGVAQYNLGTAYYGGKGVGKSLRKARHWWELAAKCQHPVAQYNLGLMYLNGLGVPSQSFRLAAKHLIGAYEAGHALAEDMLMEVERQRLLAEGPKNRKREAERKELERLEKEKERKKKEEEGGDRNLLALVTRKKRQVLPPMLGVYGVASHPLRDDHELVLIAIESNPMALEFASPRLRSDVEICVMACAVNGRALQFVSALRWEEEEKKRVLNAAVRSIGWQYVLDLMPDMLVLKEEDVESFLSPTGGVHS